MSPLAAIVWTAGLLIMSPQLASALADLPEEPAITPTLQIMAEATPEKPKSGVSQQEEAALQRPADVEAEEAQRVPQVLPREDAQEAGIVHPELEGTMHEHSDAGEDEAGRSDPGDLQLYDAERVSE